MRVWVQWADIKETRVSENEREREREREGEREGEREREGDRERVEGRARWFGISGITDGDEE